MARRRKRASTPQRRKSTHTRARHHLLRRLQQWLLTATLLLLALVVLVLGARGDLERAARRLDEWLNRAQPAAAARGRHVGILAGHMNFDSGAICPDGTTEAETTLEVAQRTVRRLRRAGAEVDLLAEYDERLAGYRADVLVSLHADSCLDRSGFKLARSSNSVIPALEDSLVTCLRQSYEAGTGLSFDPYTITEDMTGYHAFQRKDPQTAAAIIELGFLGGDSEVLNEQPEEAARGIAEGILCFLELQEQP